MIMHTYACTHAHIPPTPGRDKERDRETETDNQTDTQRQLIIA